MENNLDKIAKDLYGKIQARFPSIKIGDEYAEVIASKQEIHNARFFEFEYIENDDSLGMITITLDEDDGLVLMISGDISDAKTSHSSVYKFIRSLRKFAKTRMINFDVQDIGKSNLDKRDYKFQAKKEETNIMENKMFGTSRISYQRIGESRLIVKHSQPVNTEFSAGRSMNIKDIYIETAGGERFKYPFKHLAGARALAEHINHGGKPYDSIGKYISNLSEELQELKKFKGYVTRQEQISESMGSITSKVIERIDSIKKEINNLQKPSYYTQFSESFTSNKTKKIPENVMNDWVDRLTIKTFNENLKNAFPYLYNIIDESELPIRELTANDILDEFSNNTQNGYSAKAIEYSPEFEYEKFIEDISKTPDSRIVAFNKVLGNRLSGGDFGKQAIDPEIIDNQEILDTISSISYDDKTAEDKAIRDLISDYLTSAKPEIIRELPNLYITNPTEIGGDSVPGPDETNPVDTAPEPVQPQNNIEPPVQQPGQQPGQQPVAESKKLAKMKAKFIKAKECGASINTPIAEGVTILDAMKELGINPHECGYDDQSEESNGPETDPNKSGIQQLISIIAGFWNKEKKNFTIGGTRCKIKVRKAFNNKLCSNATKKDLARVIDFIDHKDPSGTSKHIAIAENDRKSIMKKITEQQLLEAVRSLEYTLDEYTPGVTNFTNMYAQGKKDFSNRIDKLTGQSRPEVSQQAQISKSDPNNLQYNADKVAAQPAPAAQQGQLSKSDPNNLQYNAGTVAAHQAAPAPAAQQPAPAAQQPAPAPAFNWNDKNAIKAFQSTHKQLDGKPLVVDGLIGPQTLQALANAGIQPPAGFKMANAKKQPTVSRPTNTTEPEDKELADLNRRIAADQQWFDQHQSETRVANKEPGPQTYAYNQTPVEFNDEPIRETVSFSQADTLARIIELAKR